MPEHVVAHFVPTREWILDAPWAPKPMHPFQESNAPTTGAGLAEFFMDVHFLAAEATELFTETEPRLDLRQENNPRPMPGISNSSSCSENPSGLKPKLAAQDRLRGS